MALWMGAEWAALKHCCWDTSDTTRRESSRWDYQPTFAKRRDWDKHLNLLFKGLSKKIAHGGRITFCWAKAQDEKTGNLSVHLSDSNIVSKVNLLTLIATEDLSRVRTSMEILGPALLQTPTVILGKIHIVMQWFHGVILGALNFRWLH